MLIKKLTLNSPNFPEVLQHIPQPPRVLYHAGAPLNELLIKPRLAIVGSRKVSPYGKQVTMRLAGQLAERGIVIISGLAMGVDSLAHQAALEAGGLAIAVLPSPLNHIVPSFNRRLAEKILEQGGALVSEYPEGASVYKPNFIARNRLMSGLADAVLITEAAEKSGSLHTANFALEQGKDVLAVPGNITSPGSAGTNNLIKSGAIPATSCSDVLHALGLEASTKQSQAPKGANSLEQKLLDLLFEGVDEGEALLEKSQLSASEFNQILTALEINGKIRNLGNNHWTLG